MAKATNTGAAAKNNSTTSVGAALKAAGATQAKQAPVPAAPAATTDNKSTTQAPAKPATLTSEQRKALSPEALASYKKARAEYREWRKAQRPSLMLRLTKDLARLSKVIAKRAKLFDPKKVGETDVAEGLTNASQWLSSAGTALVALGPNWKPSTSAGKQEAAKSLDAGAYITLTERGAKEAAGFLDGGVLRIKKVIANKALVVDGSGNAVVLALKHCVPCDPPATQATQEQA